MCVGDQVICFYVWGGAASIEFRQYVCAPAQTNLNPRQLKPNTLNQGTNMGQKMGHIKSLGSKCLGSAIQDHVWFRNPRQLFWQCRNRRELCQQSWVSHGSQTPTLWAQNHLITSNFFQTQSKIYFWAAKPHSTSSMNYETLVKIVWKNHECSFGEMEVETFCE